MNHQHAESVALRALLDQFQPGGAEAVLRDYLKLHKGKIGAHWLWCAVQRIVAGRETEADVLADFGYVAASPAAPAPCAMVGLTVKEVDKCSKEAHRACDQSRMTRWSVEFAAAITRAFCQKNKLPNPGASDG